MTAHDPMCLWPKGGTACECDLIARVRADERERIAQAIEADCVHSIGTGEACYRCRHAARIARNGGRDE